MCGRVCTGQCCLGKPLPPPAPPPRPRRLVVLESADGLRSTQPMDASNLVGRRFITVYMPRIEWAATETAEPVAATPYRERQYEWHGKMDGALEVWQEVVNDPPRSVPVDKVHTLISSLTAEAKRAASNAVDHRIANATHLAVEREATASALTNVLVSLRRLVKGE